MGKALRIVGRVASAILQIIGWAGVPDDLKTWQMWGGSMRAVATYLDQDAVRTVLVGVGLVILIASFIPRKWWSRAWRRFRRRAEGPPPNTAGPEATEPLAGSILVQWGRKDGRKNWRTNDLRATSTEVAKWLVEDRKLHASVETYGATWWYATEDGDRIPDRQAMFPGIPADLTVDTLLVEHVDFAAGRPKGKAPSGRFEVSIDSFRIDDPASGDDPTSFMPVAMIATIRNRGDRSSIARDWQLEIQALGCPVRPAEWSKETHLVFGNWAQEMGEVLASGLGLVDKTATVPVPPGGKPMRGLLFGVVRGVSNADVYRQPGTTLTLACADLDGERAEAQATVDDTYSWRNFDQPFLALHGAWKRSPLELIKQLSIAIWRGESIVSPATRGEVLKSWRDDTVAALRGIADHAVVNGFLDTVGREKFHSGGMMSDNMLEMKAALGGPGPRSNEKRLEGGLRFLKSCLQLEVGNQQRQE